MAGTITITIKSRHQSTEGFVDCLDLGRIPCKHSDNVLLELARNEARDLFLGDVV
jgi:hypothetical protein